MIAPAFLHSPAGLSHFLCQRCCVGCCGAAWCYQSSGASGSLESVFQIQGQGFENPAALRGVQTGVKQGFLNGTSQHCCSVSECKRQTVRAEGLMLPWRHRWKTDGTTNSLPDLQGGSEHTHLLYPYPANTPVTWVTRQREQPLCLSPTQGMCWEPRGGVLLVLLGTAAACTPGMVTHTSTCWVELQVELGGHSKGLCDIYFELLLPPSG